MLQTEFNFKSLMVKDESGQYRIATGEEIIKAAQEELKKHFSRGATMDSPDKVRELLQLNLAQREHEVFAVLWLDNKHRLITMEEMFKGTISSATVYPREVVKAALHYNAAACILAHNHPSGIEEPSQSDRDLTQRLIKALNLVDVRVLDHIIVAEKNYSFSEMGLI